MGQQCSLCFPFLYKGGYKQEIDIFDEESENYETPVNKNNYKTTTVSERKTPFSSNINPANFDKNLTNSSEDQCIMIAKEGDDAPTDYKKTKYGKEDFQILKLLGKGSFGKVMLVEKKDNGKMYAMKVISKPMVERRNQKVHTKAERTILENIECPFIVQLHYAFQTCDKLYLVMDFMIGGELFYHLRKCQRFSEAKTKFYAAEIVLALEHLHKRNIIYRDLKPENILLGADGHIKIADFGLSKQGVMCNEKTYTFCGTPDYLAPEILLGLGHDKGVDWWSLGILIYEMLGGEPPFYSKDKSLMFKNILENPIPMKPYFSPQASSLLQSLLCLDSDVRLGSSGEDAKEIKTHPFFKNIDWEELIKKKVEPPYKPVLSGKKDLSHFSKVFTDELPKDTPNMKNRDSHSQQYSNFTYVKKDNTNSSVGSMKNEESAEMLENPYFNIKNNKNST